MLLSCLRNRYPLALVAIHRGRCTVAILRVCYLAQYPELWSLIRQPDGRCACLRFCLFSTTWPDIRSDITPYISHLEDLSDASLLKIPGGPHSSAPLCARTSRSCLEQRRAVCSQGAALSYQREPRRTSPWVPAICGLTVLNGIPLIRSSFYQPHCPATQCPWSFQ